MDAPTAADVMEWSRVDFEGIDFDESSLDRIVEGQVLWVQKVTGRLFADLDEDTADPDEQWINWAAKMAVQMATEYKAFSSQPDIAETAADFNQIQSFSAGSYSETRRSPNARTRGIHPWTDLADLLMDLMTDEKLQAIQDGPAIDAADPNWDVGIGIIDANRNRIIGPFGPAVSPWE
jgi:hypothetical protein